nr:hypothetical protein [Mucilaginibacter sp. E4BP6]
MASKFFLAGQLTIIQYENGQQNIKENNNRNRKRIKG